ncbi:MAG: tRNA threonylcarbamoyl adenosine modification protein YjeE [Parcubacteria bacterium C7867-004]|nr:MAG: tRNA threonylcarbamoyl adenosine modification protein YjeE [Parcubacteria bacterium C7867-004]
MNGMEPSGRALINLDELEQEAERFTRTLLPKADAATLVTFSGELGAGKTTFVQAIARFLGVLDPVTSPTFVLAKTYLLPEGNSFERLVHLDAYRLTEENGLATTGFQDLITDPSNLILLEWPEMVKDELPQADVAISLEVRTDGTRHISYAH